MSTDLKRRNYKYYLRKSHRYLGVFIGIQFVLWTLGGLYFSWTDLTAIHGDHLRSSGESSIGLKQPLISPQQVIDQRRSSGRPAAVKAVRLVEMYDGPHYDITVASADDKVLRIIANAVTGDIRKELTGDEAGEVAKRAIAKPADISSITYLTKENVSSHHEYREKLLPAWAVTFDNPDSLTVYLSAQTGEIGAFRTGNWRLFDFLWMLHTMDYQGRDNINNYVLRGFSILGVVTILSGFSLFFASSKFWRGVIRKRRSA